MVAATSYADVRAYDGVDVDASPFEDKAVVQPVTSYPGTPKIEYPTPSSTYPLDLYTAN